jgi:thiamine-phosphate diphosphorylase
VIPRLHLVTDDSILSAGSFLARARKVLEEGGPEVAFHLRGPGLGGRALFRLGAGLAELAEGTGALLLVNDRLDVGLALGLPGAHLGQRSLPPGDARRILGESRILGLSVHDEKEAREAGAGVLDFLVAGTLFETSSHPGRRPAGLDLLDRLRAPHPLPLIGIGGITPERVREVLSAGAHGIAVRGGVWESEDPARSVGVYLRELESLAFVRPGGGPEDRARKDGRRK